LFVAAFMARCACIRAPRAAERSRPASARSHRIASS
jgi:hypothetical protein